jgi:hypothetical protein
MKQGAVTSRHPPLAKESMKGLIDILREAKWGKEERGSSGWMFSTGTNK